jgi:YidC/Oxa1 family membrane protein insertase
MGDTRNLILAIAIALGVLFLYDAFVLQRLAPEQPAQTAEQTGPGDPLATAPEGGPGEDFSPPEFEGPAATLDAALARSQRIDVRTPAIEGSIALTGARFDDLRLLRYETEVDSGVPVTLLRPQDTADAQYAVHGWAGSQGAPSGLPGLNTEWTLAEGDVLTPQSPVVLEHRAGDLVFRRTISVDEDYLFTVSDAVTNEGGEAVSLARYALVRQEGVPSDFANFFILHEGAIGVSGTEMFKRKYSNFNGSTMVERSGQGGWMGMTGKYWLTAVAPEGAPNMRAQFRSLRGGAVFESNFMQDPQSIAPGETLQSQGFVFAGAKTVGVLQGYEESAGIPRLDMAIDWGNFWFLTRPFHWLLTTFNGWLGNYGLAILLLTVLIKIPLFPLNNRAFASMAKMRAVQPKMMEIRERFAADKQRQSQEMMALYKREKINPLAGCLPILPQIPIFFALYKIVFVSIEPRHEPFFGWISDLSAPDPTTIWNLFGLIPWDPSGVPLIGSTLAIGIWPILMGITMWAQMSLNPPPPDPIQRKIFAFLPLVFTFVLAQFAAALVIYWAWNNFLTILQQYVIMRRHGTETGIERLIKRFKGEPPAAPDGTPTPKPANDGGGKSKGSKAKPAPEEKS